MAEVKLARRNFLKGAGAAGAAGAALATGLAGCSPDAATAAPAAEPQVWHTLNATEAAFISAAVDTLIPADELTPSGSDVGLAVFIDRQLAGAFGNGARLYRQGPFLPGKPEHGYQLALTPREFFRAGIEATNEWTRKTYDGRDFDRLSEDTPMLVNLKPSGQYYMEDFHKAGGMRVLLHELKDKLHLDCLTVTGRTWRELLAALDEKAALDAVAGGLPPSREASADHRSLGGGGQVSG